MANDRDLPASFSGESDLTVNEVANRYRKFADGYYVKNGKPTGTMDGIKAALRLLCRH